MEKDIPNKVLVVDRDQAIGQSIKMSLTRHKINVDFAKDVSTAHYLFNQNTYEVVLVELDFEVHGLVLIQKWRKHEVERKKNTSFIVMAGNRNDREPEETMLLKEMSGIELIYKPFTAVQLIPLFKKIAEHKFKRMELEQLSDTVRTIGKDRSKLEDALQMVQSKAELLGSQTPHLMRELYEYHDMWENALAITDKYLQENPKEISLLNQKGRILLHQGRVEEALKCMELADQQAPNNIERMNEMAMAYLKVNNPDASVEKMRKLIEFHPEQPEYRFELFAELSKAGFDEHAQSLCAETCKPMEVVRHYNNMGVALAKSGDLDKAISEYKRSLAFYPHFKENYRIHYNIALALLSKRTRMDIESALKSLDECLKLNPKFEKAQRIKALLTERLAS